MRPERPDIAAPELPGKVRWLEPAGPGEPLRGMAPADAPRIGELTAGGPVLVHFFDLAQLNSLRALPYVNEWRRRYAGLGLTVLGVHTPRHPFTADRSLLAQAASELGIGHRVADDAGYDVWRDYGCRGWPSLFLWDRGGALRWAHLGEGEYRETEREIQAALAEAGEGADALDLASMPEPMAPLRPGDAPGALVAPPTPEILPGGGLDAPWQGGGEPLRAEFEAAAAGAAVDGEGELSYALDGGETRTVELARPGLLVLHESERHGSHSLSLCADAGVRVWSIAFAAGVR